MKITESRLNRIIKESINKVLSEGEVDNFTPYSKEQAAINKMGVGRMGNPSYDNAEKANTDTKDFGTVRGYNDWNKNFRNYIDYPTYCRKFGLRR